jgi:8-oxo-dGTP pyrophosphatase MutT (NUDIX family)
MTTDYLRRAAEPALRRALHLCWRFARGLTLGVRGLVVSPAGEVLLIKHSYIPGWHLPGGGVEPGETVLDALARELAEEGNVALLAEPKLHGLYFNDSVSRRDHVALFVVHEYHQDGSPRRNREIVDHGFFAPTALPSETAAGTRRRIAEVLGGAPISERW